MILSWGTRRRSKNSLANYEWATVQGTWTALGVNESRIGMHKPKLYAGSEFGKRPGAT